MKNISLLSDEQLVLDLKNLVQKEREILHVILEHVCEVSRRDLHLARGYDSLAKYLMYEFGYSEAAAYRRVDAAKMIMTVPSVAKSIQDGSLNLTQISEVARSVKEKQKTTGAEVSATETQNILMRIEGLSSHQTQQVVAQCLNLKVKEHERVRVQADQSVRIEVSLSTATREKLDRCKELASHKLHELPGGFTLAGLIDFLAQEYLDENQVLDSTAPVREVLEDTEFLKTPAKVNRTLTPKTKALTLMRDRCCQYVDPVTDRKCGTRMFLQTDHIEEKWLGGNHARENLQVYCGPHNRFKHKQVRRELLLLGFA